MEHEVAIAAVFRRYIVAPNPEEARAIAFDRFMQATDTMGMPADTVAVLRPGEDERIAEEIGLAGYG